ncbi:uncharacterized protein BP5553_06787 [Venustampulla echinocandica]|uniref:Uncharacterized protein n=1 Tax=Venustampulla echinocandica TaxID=2656787 RepID=A0A370TKY4_9HELO|nr:uncharacterized protein BP5553_06787 [Venustampulla echinocandica]RDL36175.1 hypothetical protein BP5553_06787 [Venustampulla echinocandica]
MGTLIRDCDPTPKYPMVPNCRKAGASVYCKIKHDPTRLCFDYIDGREQYIKYTQTDQLGKEYINIRWNGPVERLQAQAIVAWDREERTRFDTYNRTCFVNEVCRALHFWYHVGYPYQNVPTLGFEAVQPSRYGLYLFRLREEVDKQTSSKLTSSKLTKKQADNRGLPPAWRNLIKDTNLIHRDRLSFANTLAITSILLLLRDLI